jgi:hypothetical protein
VASTHSHEGSARARFAFERGALVLVRGAPKKKKKATYIWQMINQVGSTSPSFFVYGVFVRFSTRGVQKHHKKRFGENPCQNLLAEKVEKKFLKPDLKISKNLKKGR